MEMQHAYGHAVWIWTCSIDMDIHHYHEHTALAWTHSSSFGYEKLEAKLNEKGSKVKQKSEILLSLSL
jgi:hypothetical protein